MAEADHHRPISTLHRDRILLTEVLTHSLPYSGYSFAAST